MLADSPNGAGLTLRCMWAYSQPARPASIAAYVKASIRVRGRATPKLAAAAAPPRKARMPRPARLSIRLRVSSSTPTTASQTTTKYSRLPVSARVPNVSGGMPEMPSLRPTRSKLPNR